ncbi:MAG: carboxypeptidase-like regulatory domain-containing protein [Saprospiraceae bacterium]|nr:carboxypeptidase-like regulatory domain-containing protein [Bacteroidia bacterium]NNL92734.1 carboxypeptidase-like regulatory domain-containing protein [Saprospiraceae bacterium]
MQKIYKAVFIFLGSVTSIFAQVETDSSKVIQFSGVVVTVDEYGEMVPLPYTTVAIQDTDRGTYAEVDGFFSIVAEVGDTIVFSRVGFETIKHGISDTLDSNYYSWYQIMSRDNVLLPEAVIYPWPSRDHYKIEFLALDVSNELRQRAKENLAREVLERMQHAVPADGTEAFALTMEKRVEEFKYSGQYKPQNIFNVAAWAQFVQAWKRGDFKRKKDKKK